MKELIKAYKVPHTRCFIHEIEAYDWLHLLREKNSVSEGTRVEILQV